MKTLAEQNLKPAIELAEGESPTVEQNNHNHLRHNANNHDTNCKPIHDLSTETAIKLVRSKMDAQIELDRLHNQPQQQRRKVNNLSDAQVKQQTENNNVHTSSKSLDFEPEVDRLARVADEPQLRRESDSASPEQGRRTNCGALESSVRAPETLEDDDELEPPAAAALKADERAFASRAQPTTKEASPMSTPTPSPTPTPTPAPQQQAPRPELSTVKKFTVDCLLYLIKSLVSTYDLISWPFYFAQQGVAKRRREVEYLRSRKADPDDPDSPWRQVDISKNQIEIERQIDSFETYDEMMKSSFEKNADSPCYAYRQIVEEVWVKKPEGGDKLLRQVRLTDYKWCSYGQFNQQIEAARKGFLRDGVRAGQKVILFADTRAEWQIASQALLRLGAIVCTMYSTLGVDGIVHTCNETKATLVVTQRDKVERLLRLRERIPGIKRVVYFDSSLHLPQQLGGDQQDEDYIRKQHEFSSGPNEFEGQAEAQVECINFTRILGLGLKQNGGVEEEQIEKENQVLLADKTKDSLAVIMYTSGSTGIPKGVLISHGNIMATVKSFSYVTKDFIINPKENTCTAYLPLAHIFEFCIESVMLYHGVSYGFATPHTLTDKSPGLVPGEKGDLGLLKPTVMIIVPLILDRVVQGVKQALKADSYFKEQLVTYLIDYKIYWQKRHYDTPLVNKIVCNKIAQALGGRAKWVICGSAPLSSQTQTFVRAALNLKLPQGFGTTETCAATACQLFDDQSTQNVGLPVAGAQIKLEPWLEGNYQPTDKPNPRGEIVVGGEMICKGYFNLEEQTKEAFYVDDKGTRWYRTGDIGEFLPNGQLKIIDRKKDLVKLQNGEYISLGRVESTLKSNPYTDNFCIYANSNHNYIVALGPANEPAIRQLARQIVDEHERALSSSPSSAKRQGSLEAREERQGLLLNGQDDELAMAQLKQLSASYLCDTLNNNENASAPKLLQPTINDRLKQLCSNKLIIDHVLGHICKMARDRNLMSLEVPKKLLLIAEEWTEDKNLVTAAMKIRRNYIYKRYESELEQLYRA